MAKVLGSKGKGGVKGYPKAKGTKGTKGKTNKAC